MKLLGIPALVAVVLCSSGCVDYGRIGMHKVTFSQAAPRGSPTEEERLTQLVQESLTGKGFDEMAGTPHIWRKRGATVQVYRDNGGDVILKIRAFGSRRDVRVSERTEQELLAILNQHAELSISLISPPSPTK